MKAVCREAATSDFREKTAARWLGEFEEAIGVLQQTYEFDGVCMAAFSWGLVSLPLEMTDRLQSITGKKIAILRLDGFRLRVLDG